MIEVKMLESVVALSTLAAVMTTAAGVLEMI